MNIEKVLVVDDSKVAHLTLRKMLTERGIGVDWVGSGEDSIAYLQQQKPDVIFMDVMMPGMDGFETAHAINQNANVESMPIIMCSANATEEDRKNAEKSGAIDFLSKPYTAAELDQILNKVRSIAGGAEPIPEPEVMTEAAEEMTIDEPEAVFELDELPSIDEFSNDLEPALMGGAEEDLDFVQTAGNEPVATAQAAVSEEAILQRAEQIAQRVAEKIARQITTMATDDIAERARQSAEEVATRKATQAAAHVAKTTTQSVAKEIVRSISEQVTRKVNDIVTQHTAAQKAAAPDPDQLKADLIKVLDGNITRQVTASIDSEQIQQRLLQLVEQHALPRVDEAARSAARQVVEEFSQQMAETDQSPAALSRANTALFIGLLALIVAGGMLVINFLL
jgi:CheY-like chemotaxis protein